MISPFTKSGTEVVCVNDELWRYTIPGFNYRGSLDGLTKGSVYTVSQIVKAGEGSYSDHEIILREIRRPGERQGFAIERFRYLDLAGLDALLTQSIINPLEHEQTR
jgi:hypothetical protein